MIRPEGVEPAQRRVMTVIERAPLCREHARLTLAADEIIQAEPGQFLHLGAAETQVTQAAPPVPWLRRAFSIADLRSIGDASHLDIIYRVVGSGTRWLDGLQPGDRVDALGPQGNTFPVPPQSAETLLVAGGVGLPPLQWFSRKLARAGRSTTMVFGARSADLVPMEVEGAAGRLRAKELGDTPLILATDDGSAGYHGNVVQVLEKHVDAESVAPQRICIYTCGPEVMMHAVATWCRARAVRCYACLERSMACGIGTCQSCVVPVRDAKDVAGWRYELCCTDGPVFDAAEVVWTR